MKIIIIMMISLLLVSCSPVAGPDPYDEEPPVEVPAVEPTDETVVEPTEETVEEPMVEKSPLEILYENPFSPVGYSIVDAFPSLSFDQPLYLTHDGKNPNKVYVVEKTGKIKVFDKDSPPDSVDVFVDLSDRISLNGNEKGLLGLAFHPKYSENGLYFVYYTDQEGSVISRMTEGMPDSETILLTYNQPYSNHNGGHIAFGPDGYLYIASGDGGSSGDPMNNAQDTGSYLGKILRIDVDNTEGELAYAIPEDNPFNNGESENLREVYAYGLRNPWRFSFDELRALLITADVGQNKMEEINLIENGGNYGWNIMEGTLDYTQSSVDKSTFIAPIWTYEHPIGKSITGGYTYYGSENPSLYGTYIYGDFISGKIWGLWLDADQTPDNHELLDTELMISSFGIDADSELYLIDYQGKIYKLREN
ncbi:MAG: PQQ-dependent sugar dehydrogenase [Clostridiales bacterium]|nr:PQQ-dependent sugar dehydrogenase [Clostridiales bacterium]